MSGSYEAWLARSLADDTAWRRVQQWPAPGSPEAELLEAGREMERVHARRRLHESMQVDFVGSTSPFANVELSGAAREAMEAGNLRITGRDEHGRVVTWGLPAPAYFWLGREAELS